MSVLHLAESFDCHVAQNVSYIYFGVNMRDPTRRDRQGGFRSTKAPRFSAYRWNKDLVLPNSVLIMRNSMVWKSYSGSLNGFGNEKPQHNLPVLKLWIVGGLCLQKFAMINILDDGIIHDICGFIR